ncbi:MAG TPA: PD-(D/E)XK nuclease family protein [Methanobacterium sp.]
MTNKSGSKPHPTISQVKIIANKNNFPISWLNKQGFCEYGIYLENVKGIEVKPTKSMINGTKEHAILEDKFKDGSEPATFDEMLETSKTGEIFSRELPVISKHFGIRGFIDEVWMTPDEFIIIDDKPGKVAYSSSINQVYGYCLAFKEMVPEKRRIIASLRQRGTENIYWSSYFDGKAEEDIINLINRMHSLLSGETEFLSTNNPNKCRGCRFNTICDRKMNF